MAKEEPISLKPRLDVGASLMTLEALRRLYLKDNRPTTAKEAMACREVSEPLYDLMDHLDLPYSPEAYAETMRLCKVKQ